MNAATGDGEAKTAEQKQVVIDAHNGVGKALRQFNPLLEILPSVALE